MYCVTWLVIHCTIHEPAYIITDLQEATPDYVNKSDNYPQ